MKLYKLSIALILGLSVLSCTKEMNKELPAPKDQSDLVTIKASLSGEELTRAAASNGFSWTWSEGDRLAVSADGKTQMFSIVSGFSSKTAEFSGKAVEGENFTIQYPDADVAKASWLGQKQKGNDNIDHLRYAASLEGVDEYTTFAFNDVWAGNHGGILKQTGVLKMIITLPDTVKTVMKVTVSADAPVFYTGNGNATSKKLELEMEETEPNKNHQVIAWMTTSWNEVTIKAGESLTVAVKVGEKGIEKTVNFAKDGVLKSGKVNLFEIDGAGWTGESHYPEGKGTASSPWVITTLEQLLFMKDDLVAGDIRYFELGADIDMTGVDWTPLNSGKPYDKQIDFNGNGHTISNFSCSAASYPSFFGVLYGKCYDVKFVNATISSTANGCGILGGYGGTTDKPAEATNVHVQGTVTSTAKNVGALFGVACECTISRCSAEATIEGKGQMCGGLIGLDSGLGVHISDCWTSGSLYSGSSICGGICGDLTAEGSSIVNCYSTMTVQTQYIFGGIVGRANKAAKTNAANCNANEPNNHIEYCIAWNDALESKNCSDESEHYSSGAIVGGTAIKNYLKGCVRKSDLVFKDVAGNAAKGTDYAMFDQDDADPEHPLVTGTGTYAFAYHGKAAASGKTLSDVAKDLGWSAEIWDMSGATPKLK